jgi:hypothetical protein
MQREKNKEKGHRGVFEWRGTWKEKRERNELKSLGAT